MVDRPAADIRFGDFGDGDRGLDAHGDPDRLELRLERESVDDHREHAHVVRGRLLDAMLGHRGAAHDVPAADHHRDLHGEVAHLLDLLGQIARVLRGDTELTVAQKGFAGELQQHSVVFRLRLHGQSERSLGQRAPTPVSRASSVGCGCWSSLRSSPSAKRVKRRTRTFSPVDAASPATSSPIVRDASRM